MMQLRARNSGPNASTAISSRWIQQVFQQCECGQFIQDPHDPYKCGCGRERSLHDPMLQPPIGEWQWRKHSIIYPTDSYGTVEFANGVHARYLRMSPNARPDDVIRLITEHWGADPPKLIVTIHGGMGNFELQPRIKRALRRSLQRMAAVPGCWIITNGLNTGVSKHIGDALTAGILRRNRTVVIGILPWGVIAGRQRLAVPNGNVLYFPLVTASGAVVLNPNHSFFLLVDDGSVGRYGHELNWRRGFEASIKTAPLIGVFIGGGTSCIRLAVEYLIVEQKPIVVVAESGRASTVLSVAMQKQDESTVAAAIEEAFILSPEKIQEMLHHVFLCANRGRNLVSVWSAMASNEELDVCILGALLNAQTRTPQEKLRLALAWNRVDLAKERIFVDGLTWPEGVLNEAMFEALAMNRVEFVQLLLKQGISMAEALSLERLERLYNLKHPDIFFLHEIARSCADRCFSQGQMTLQDVGATMEVIMGYGYRSNVLENHYNYPFNQLLIWAVLSRRHAMARLMLTQGEEMLAKAIIASRLNRSMAILLEQDFSPEIVAQLKENGKDFAKVAVDLLEKCRQLDDVMAQQLLTYELQDFSRKTCLSLAVSATLKHLVADPCCQSLLDALWMGGLRLRSTRPWKILLGLFFPPFAIFGLDYLTQEELNLQPQTEAEIEEQRYSNSDSSGNLSPSSSEGSKSRRVSRYSNAGGSFRRPQRRIAAIELTPTPNRERNAKPSFQHTQSTQRLTATADQSDFDYSKDVRTPLKIQTRFAEFYNAPVTKFWIHTVGYLIFILCFCYTILTRSSPYEAQWPEIYITLYVLTLFFDKCREIISIDAHSWKARVDIFYRDFWNIVDAFAILLFIVGLPLRWEPESFEAGRAFWIVASVFFLIHVFDIFQANQALATYIMILASMMRQMFSFLIILWVVVAIYGIVLQATRFPYRIAEWDILKNIWPESFLNLYGETYHEFVDTNQCDPVFLNSTSREKPPCWCCTWIGPLFQAVYLIVANILMLNLLVAVFNSVYEKVDRISQDLTRFQRYRLIVDYQLMPILPPPFIFFNHIYLLFRAIRRLMKGRQFGARDPGLLKIVLNDADLEKLRDFEEQARDELLEQIESNKSSQSIFEEQLRAANERAESVQTSLEKIVQQEAAIVATVREFELRLSAFDAVGEKNRVGSIRRKRSLIPPPEIVVQPPSPTSEEGDTSSNTGDEHVYTTPKQSSISSTPKPAFRRLKAVSETESCSDDC